MRLSYLNLKTTDPATNLATEQYVFESLPKDRAYFMLWQNDNAIILGKHQNTLAEINDSFVKENNIKVIRRLSGGGAVYHDLGNLNFTFIADAQDKNSLDFSLFCQPVVNTLKDLGINAELNGRNDMTIEGKKFSGNSQYIKDGRVLHHGTLLFQSDLSVVEKALTVDPEKIQAKGVKSVRSRITNISDYLKAETALESFRSLLLNNIISKHESEEYILTAQDKAAIESIAENRYNSWQWNYGHNTQCTMLKKGRVEGCGTVQAHITLKKGLISDVQFFGDFFSISEPADLAKLLIGIRPEKEEYEKALKGIDVKQYFTGLTNVAFIDLITR